MFTIYRLTSPENKVYIGCTSHHQLKHRFGVGGTGYMNQHTLWSAIQRLGWANFKSEILYQCDSREVASQKERYYIELYDATNPDKGYNVREGGLGSPLPPVSSATARKISKGRSGLVTLRKDNMVRHVSPQQVDEMLAAGWERGGRRLTDAEKQHLRECNLGKTASAETRAKLSAQRRGLVIMHKDNVERKVSANDVPSYLESGYVMGRSELANEHNQASHIGLSQSPESNRKRSEAMKGKFVGRKQIHRGNERKLIPASDLDTYLADGWELGVGSRKKPKVSG